MTSWESLTPCDDAMTAGDRQNLRDAVLRDSNVDTMRRPDCWTDSVTWHEDASRLFVNRGSARFNCDGAGGRVGCAFIAAGGPMVDAAHEAPHGQLIRVSRASTHRVNSASDPSHPSGEGIPRQLLRSLRPGRTQRFEPKCLRSSLRLRRNATNAVLF